MNKNMLSFLAYFAFGAFFVNSQGMNVVFYDTEYSSEPAKNPEEAGEYTFEKRWPAVRKGLQDSDFAVLSMQEVQKGNLALLLSHFGQNIGSPADVCDSEVNQDLDNENFWAKYSGEEYDSTVAHFSRTRSRKDQFLMCVFKKSLVELFDSRPYHFHDFIDERSAGTVLCNSIRDKQTGQILHILNLHMHSNDKRRSEATKILPHILEEYLGEGYETEKIIIGGLFNAFGETGQDQVHYMERDCRMTDFTQRARYKYTNRLGTEGERAESSFNPRPWDRRRMPRSAFDQSGRIIASLNDRAFGKGIECSDVWFDNRTVKQVLGDRAEETAISEETPSDHFMLGLEVIVD